MAERDLECVGSPDGEDLDRGASWVRSSSRETASNVEVVAWVGDRIGPFDVDDGVDMFEVSTVGTEALLLCRP